MVASLAADFPVEMASQPLSGVRSKQLAMQGLLCITRHGRLVHRNPLPLGMWSSQPYFQLQAAPLVLMRNRSSRSEE